MTDYLRHLAAKNLNLEKGVAPRLPSFFERAAFAGTPFNGSTYLDQDLIPGEREGPRTEPRTSSLVASNTASDQSPISVQSEGARTTGSMSLIPAKPDTGFRDAGPSTESHGTRSFRYIFKNRGNRVLRQIRPMKNDLLSSGVRGRTPSLIPSQREYPVRFEPESKERTIGLDYKQVPFAAQAHISDMVEKKRGPRRRSRWVTTYAHQKDQNCLPISDHIEERPTRVRTGRYDELVSPLTHEPKCNLYQLEMSEKGLGIFSSEGDCIQSQVIQSQSIQSQSIQSQNQPEQKNQDMKGPGHANSQKNSQIELANVVDLSEAHDSPKGAVLDPLLPSSNSRPKIADFKMVREKTNSLQQALHEMAKKENDKSGSIFERRPEGNHSRLRKADDIDQKISRRTEITGTAATVVQPNTGIKQSAASMSEQPLLDQSLLFSELRPQITDIVNDRKNGSFLVKAISIESMPDGRSRAARAGYLEMRNAADSYQVAARSSVKAFSPPLDANEKSAIQVTIGRIEVRAERPNRVPSAPPACRTASVSRLSLDEYLKQRSAGQI